MSVQNAVEEFSRETSEMGNGRVFLPTGMPTLVEGGTSKNFFCKYQRPRPRVSQLRPRPQTVRGRPYPYTLEAGAYFNGFEGSTSPESQGRAAGDPRRGGDFSPQVFKFRQKSSYHMLHHATLPPAQLHWRATDSPTASDLVRT